MDRRDKKSKLAALAELKRAREGGGRTLKEEDATLYDEVSEDQYRRIVKGRLQRDDFVVDDGVEGYMDNGMDDWAGGDEEHSASEDEVKSKKNKKVKKTKDSGAKRKPRAPSPAVAPSINDYRKAVSAEQESDFMASLLGDMDTLPTTKPAPKSRKRKTSPSYDYAGTSSPYSYRDDPSFTDHSSDGPIEDLSVPPSSDDIMFSPKKKPRTDSDAMIPATQRLAQMDVHGTTDEEDDFAFDTSFDDVDIDALMQEEDAKPTIKTEPTSVDIPKAKEEEALPSWLSVYDSLNVSSSEALGPLSSNPSSVKSTNVSALESDDSLYFYWLDYLEHEGQLYFVGKVKDKSSGAWVSCCVTVENLERNLFVLSRERRVEEGEDGKFYDTDEVPEQPDVYRDFDMIRKRAKIGKFRAKFVKRKYAFGEPNIPNGEAEWLKVVYPFTEPQLPSTAQSPNIARIFGTSTSAFELLVLKRKIMGPCWIHIKNPIIEHKGVSWCKLEATVNDPKDFNPASESDPNAPKDMPSLTVMSLSVRTIVNHRENKKEVVCAAARTWHNMVIDDPTPPEKLPCTVQAFVRPLDRFPNNFEAQAKMNGKGIISPLKNERMLLSSFLATLHRADPDIIVGHDFLGVSLDALLHRMRDLKVEHWSRIGRFRRSRWPNIGRQGTNMKFLTGRLLCDLTSDGAKSMISSTTWSLTEMCKTHLKSDRQDIDPDDTTSYMDGSVGSPDKMMTFVRHCEMDSHFHMAIASKVQIIGLTKQLTNLAGNSWNKTLNGGRAERNEYILLHEFHRLKYICPDKQWGKKFAVKAEPTDDPDALEDVSKSKKRDKYKGGKVLEPKKGLWDTYVLVMDFNSLYPSIIQEYNIDFTTVERLEEEEDEHGEPVYAEPPSPETPQGVLPRLIATLVQRRRQVKSLMKDPRATPAQLLQYDIKQQALKLTANSMYGCLGFEHSRFYARQLAALTTYKGREILTNTIELAESLNFTVVYGDTDSVFVNSNVSELSEALKISAEFKKAVNDRYKLLEIDLDAVFQRLLLLQKKKYAAVKVVDQTRTSTEVKGLDMKRREYCELSKTVSQFVLDKILSGEPTEITVEQIHEYLTTVGENVRQGNYKLDSFVIHKRLGKNPEEYPKSDGQPHVQVALKMKAKGGTARAGDVIPYIFCLPEGEQTAKTGQANRAHHRDELRRADSDLKIDYDYYLSQQVLPPVERLCEPIEGIDRARLAECLGLDPNRYRSVSAQTGEDHSFSSLDSQLSDAERFRDAKPFEARCSGCKGEFDFKALNEEACCILPAGVICPNPDCGKFLGTGSLQMQLEAQIRKHIALYYEGWIVCTDRTCGHRTRSMGVYGRYCLRCREYVQFEYTDLQLYNQLRYYYHLFDGSRAIKVATGTTSQEAINALVTANSEFLASMSKCVEKHLNQCGRRWVDLSNIFSFMRV
ncbi:DNA polymerase alpha catalytic subunit [Dendrothele bispora CBS 962.96]|uniref:DNA polymerase n=1 Tax=Dendrothele bispora (strain CBS 962.96) TaxID=1314807 RepID=A0A4S8MRU0_DENBC|nr:DNA polymerase alpha catalytic subunit [Dendrothele bispora CBS 962.96]